MAYRRGATFVRNALERSTPLDRNQRARILFIAEGLDRATKAKGRRNGCLGYVGLVILKCLLLGFQNGRTGLCCPSYDAISERTGLCRQSVARGLQRLAAAGILGVVRRLDRVNVGGIVRCQQATNLYSFTIPSGRIPLPIPRASRRRPVIVPARGAIGEVVSAVWRQACESTQRAGTIKRIDPMKASLARGTADWRAKAQAMLAGAQKRTGTR